ncbi:hypothetical protein D3P04_19780 [Paracoccus onubensis]|uniref:Uncharacterized protein n=1 Tax=Paracoccus onubensis TaxID=1675788 RepID=A0A418SN60_9RHOB|nr:hypothetical protein D3P04_19780 [Paracoccus onubensis]
MEASMLRYHYRATRKSDGIEIKSGNICVRADEGMGVVAANVKAALIKRKQSARGLTADDIDITMWVMKSSVNSPKECFV